MALFEPGYKERILQYSPAGKVPVLIDGEVAIWESLAIGEYLAETLPEHEMWPLPAAERALARSISVEMHAGFPQLRTHMPMNIRASHPGKGRAPGVEADIARVCALWEQCLIGSGGPFLFGNFTTADAMYAPVCTRFMTYDVKLDPRCAEYCRRIIAHPAKQEWIAAGKQEPDEVEELEEERPNFQ